MVREKEVSAAEVTAAAVGRAQQASSIGAIVLECYERAAAEAARLDRDAQPSTAALGGVPTFIKDQIDIAGLPTRYGSAAHSNAGPAKRTDPVAQQLFDMGLVSLGKSTLPEYGFTASTEFPDREPTRNPWNLAHTAGGSSGGAAALVAAGVVPIAHAADGGGSIRIPASCCGLVVMKPSRGRLPKSGMAEPFVGIVTDGVVTRSVRDTAAYLTEAERLKPNRKLKPVGSVKGPLNRSLKIGVVIDPPLGIAVAEETRRELLATIGLLESLGHAVEVAEVPIGAEFRDDFTLFWSALAGLVAATAKRTHDRTFDRTQLTEYTLGLGRQARASKRRLPGTVRRLRHASRETAAFFEGLDVVLTPTTAAPPPVLGELSISQPAEVLMPKFVDWACFTPWANVSGCPSLSLPLGFDEPSSLPIGMLFTAAVGEERLLLELALQLEQAKPFRSLAAA
jgi:amidase